jgi:hypothetical protein
MRWLPRLLSHAAAAGKATAAARSTASHVRGGSHGFASGGWEASSAVPREWLRKLWKRKEAARETGAFARSYQYDDRDLDPVEVSGFWKLWLQLLLVFSLFYCHLWGNICFDPMIS